MGKRLINPTINYYNVLGHNSSGLSRSLHIHLLQVALPSRCGVCLSNISITVYATLKLLPCRLSHHWFLTARDQFPKDLDALVVFLS